jgi:uncharacterized protein (TIGR02996 family)
MSEEDVLIRAVLDCRGDACPRLIYADWLEERGDPRGEYLRLLTVLDGHPDSEQDPEALQKRLRELEAGIDMGWIALMHRGRIRRESKREEDRDSGRTGRRRSRREALEAEVAIVVRRDAHNRSYYRGASRKVEKIVRRMNVEDLGRFLHDGGT